MGKRNIAKGLEEFGVVEAFREADRNFKRVAARMDEFDRRLLELESKVGKEKSGILGADGAMIPKA